MLTTGAYCYGITDFGALELVTFAQGQLDLLGRSALADLLRADKDPHRAFACRILGIAYEDFDGENKAHKNARQLSKAWNFGKPGAMGKRRFIDWAWNTYDLRITDAQHDALDREWKAAFPEVEAYWALVKRYQNGSDVKGRPLHEVRDVRTGYVRGGCGFPDACNQLFQHRGSVVAKQAGWDLFLAGLDPTSPLHGCYQVLMAHDEYVTVMRAGSPVPCPAHVVPTKGKCKRCGVSGGTGRIWPVAERALAEQERVMIAASAQWCPDVPMKVESMLRDRYTK